MSLKQQRLIATAARQQLLGLADAESIPIGEFLPAKISALSIILATAIGKAIVGTNNPEFTGGYLWSLVTWAELGFPTFELSHGLTASLMLTEPSVSSEFHLPFESLVVCLPPEVPMEFEISGRIERATNIAACELPAWKSAEDLAKFKAARTQEDVVHGLVGGNFQNKLYSHIIGHIGGAFHFTDPWSLVGGQSWLDGLHETEVTHQTPMDVQANRLKNRLLSNLFDYIESDHGKADVAAARLRGRGRQSGTLQIGSTINLPAPGHFLKSMGSDDAHWSLEHRFMVRGHWRMQPHGPERSLRKKIWVMPFWKGPDDAVDVSRRIYRVSERDLA